MKKFSFEYNGAEAIFEVDESIFTENIALEGLEFFTWDWDRKGDPVVELLKKYAIEAIREATYHSYNCSGVISEFSNKEGFIKIDGSLGIKLTYINGLDMDGEIGVEISEID